MQYFLVLYFHIFCITKQSLTWSWEGVEENIKKSRGWFTWRIEENFVSNSQVGKQLKYGAAVSLVNQMMDLIHVC
jgi:hypothetical protein